MRLLELESLWILLEQRDVVGKDAVGVRFGAACDGVTNDGVQRVALAHRLLHEAPALELGERRAQPRDARKLGERCRIYVIAFYVREHSEDAARCLAEPRPSPADEQRDLG